MVQDLKHYFIYKKILLGQSIATLVGVLCLVLGGFFSGAQAQNFQVSGGETFRVMRSGPVATSSSFGVSAEILIQNSGGNLTGPPNFSGAIEPVVVAVPEVVVEEEKVVQGSTGGGGEKYDASGWVLKRKYDQLVADRESEQEELLASAPEVLYFENHGPVEGGYIPGEDFVDLETVSEFEEDLEGSSDSDVSVEKLIKVDRMPHSERVDLQPKTPEQERIKLEFDLHSGDVIDEPLLSSAQTLDSDPVVEVLEEVDRCDLVVVVLEGDDRWYPIAHRLWWILLGLNLIFVCLAFLVAIMVWRNRASSKKSSSFWRDLWKKFFMLMVVIGSFGFISEGQAATTTPQVLVYEGNLLDSLGSPVAGSYDFRFSFWTDTDYTATDVVAGVINAGSPTYLGWEEVQTDVLLADGAFSFQVGSVTAFIPELLDSTDLYFQVEVKAAADPVSSYELIDVDGADVLVDRKVIASVPHANNADKLDFRDLGFGLGEIPYLDDVTGLLPDSILGGSTGVNGNTFLLDKDGDANVADSLVLQFGSALGQTLAWNGVADRFELSDDFEIDGDLVVTGTINGQVLGTRDQTIVLSPRYPNSIFEADGANNLGDMYEETDVVGGSTKHILRWRTDQVGTIQDYDTLIRYTLPGDFDGFQATPLSLDYKTVAGLANSKIDITVEKEGVAGVDQLSGAGLDLGSASWTTQDFNLTGGANWAAGDVMWIKIKMSALGAAESYVSDIRINLVSN